MKTNKKKAVAFILLSAFGFALMNTFVRLSGDLPFTQKTFFRNLVALFAALLVIRKEKISVLPKKENVGLLILRSVTGTVGIFCNFYAVDHLNLADASMLNKMSPFFVILFCYLLLKERPTLFQWAAVVLAFLGSMLIVKPGLAGFSPAAVIGLLGGMGAGLAYTFVRMISANGEKSARIVFFFSTFSALCSLPFLLFDYRPMRAEQLIYLLLAGLSATLGQFGVTLAYSHAPAKEISVYDYTQVAFAALLGFFLFGQVPDHYSILGYLVICGVSIAVFIYNMQRERRA